MRRIPVAVIALLIVLSACESSQPAAPAAKKEASAPKKHQDDRWGPSLTQDWDREDKRQAEAERRRREETAAAERAEQARKAREREEVRRREEERARQEREEAERKIAEERAQVAKEELETKKAEKQHRREIEDARVTWDELEGAFVADGTVTPDKREELWKAKYRGKWIKWTGTVQFVDDAGQVGGGLVLGLKMSAATLTYDLIVHCEESCRTSVAKLNTGQTATIIGTLDRWSRFLHVSQGRVVET